ncbi:MAG: PBP1A family penicillin-binding protein [Desulfobacterales bacterium]
MKMTSFRFKKNIAILFLLIFGMLLGGMVGFFIALTKDLPQIRNLESFKPSSITRIYSRDGALLSELFWEKRDPVSIKIIPDLLKKAMLVTEDRSFYTHSGIDLKGIFRAAFRDIKARRFVEGASTITQQLSKTLFLKPRKTLLRKAKEAFLSFQIERRYTKDEILELYLNQVYFGSGAYGVESAARIYFGKSVSDLNLPECALLAGLPRSPSRYSPLVDEDLAIKRRNVVLKQLKDTGVITSSAYDTAKEIPLHLAKQDKASVKAPYFIEYVKKFLENTIGSSRLYKEGLTVVTTLDFKMQKIAEIAVEKGLSNLEKRMKRHAIKNPEPQCALISLDVSSGEILAMVGGRDFSKSTFNRATNARRQPGSAFKPIVYAYAVEKGFPQNKIILDAPVAFNIGNRKKYWQPQNFSKNYEGEMTLRKALALSKNIPAVRLIEVLGPSSVAGFGHAMGIESPLDRDLSLALGTSEVTLLDLTKAYSVFPNKGKRIEPYGVMEVVDRAGRMVWHAKPQKKVVISRATAAIMTDMLRNVIQHGTGQRAKCIQDPVAGKTGTTDEFKDALFIGFSPSITTGVWVGQDAFTTIGNGETGARSALPIWIDFMSGALKNKPLQYFDIPDDIVIVPIHPSTGRLAADNASDAVKAFFKKGTEPTPSSP